MNPPIELGRRSHQVSPKSPRFAAPGLSMQEFSALSGLGDGVAVLVYDTSMEKGGVHGPCAAGGGQGDPLPCLGIQAPLTACYMLLV